MNSDLPICKRRSDWTVQTTVIVAEQWASPPTPMPRVQGSHRSAKTVQRCANHRVQAGCSTQAAVLPWRVLSQCSLAARAPCVNVPWFVILVARTCVPDGFIPLVVGAHVRYVLGCRRLQG
jgi:hypothetical protein